MGGVGVVYPKSGPELNFLNVHQMILEDRKLFRQSSLLQRPITTFKLLANQMILEDKKLFRQLNASNFDLAIVDLIANECRLLTNNIFHKLDNFGQR